MTWHDLLMFSMYSIHCIHNLVMKLIPWILSPSCCSQGFKFLFLYLEALTGRWPPQHCKVNTISITISVRAISDYRQLDQTILYDTTLQLAAYSNATRISKYVKSDGTHISRTDESASPSDGLHSPPLPMRENAPLTKLSKYVQYNIAHISMGENAPLIRISKIRRCPDIEGKWVSQSIPSPWEKTLAGGSKTGFPKSGWVNSWINRLFEHHNLKCSKWYVLQEDRSSIYKKSK